MPISYLRLFVMTPQLKPNPTRLSTMRRHFFGGRHSRMNVDAHVYAPAQLIEHNHQTVYGEAVKPYVANAAEVRMTDTGTGLGLARRKPFIVKNANDVGGQKRLGLLHVGVSASEVAEDIAAAMHQLEIVACLAHCRNSFFNRFSRSPIRSISFFGVLTPCFAFFWKACKTQTRSSSCRA